MNNCPRCRDYSIVYSNLLKRVHCLNPKCDYSVNLNEKDLLNYNNNGYFALEDFLRSQKEMMSLEQ